MKFIVFILFLAGFVINCSAQTNADTLTRTPDTVAPSVVPQTSPRAAITTVDTTARRAETTRLAPTVPAVPEVRQSYFSLLKGHPYYNFYGNPLHETAIRRSNEGKEGLFYLFIGLILYFALIRLIFGKYLHNLFALFFRVSLKQKQIREQLLQSTLPSLLLNIFFIIIGGIYATLLLRYYHYEMSINLWQLILYCILALTIMYIGKFVILKTMGWIFNIMEATDTYIFVVFLVNKLLGIFLIPFLVVLAFSSASVVAVMVIISFAIIAVFFAYRYIVSYSPVRKEIKVSQFHFFLYICAFEIIPLLLIYKVLLTFLERSR